MFWRRLLLGVALGLPLICAAASGPAVQHSVFEVSLRGGAEASTALKIVLGLTVLSLAPAILMSMTSFIRIVIVLSILRHALGMQETPPNTVLISLALFLTVFTMAEPLQQINTQAVQPLLEDRMSATEASKAAVIPLKSFMARQTREQDISLMLDLAKVKEKPESLDAVSLFQLVPAFMLSELRTAFQVGFIVFLPFVMIDLIVSSALMALGMMMVPPISIALPLKLLVFVLVDGWNLVVRALVVSFE